MVKSRIFLLLTGTVFGGWSFHNEHKEPFSFIDGKVIIIGNSEFKDWLSYRFYKSEKKAPSSEVIPPGFSGHLVKPHPPSC